MQVCRFHISHVAKHTLALTGRTASPSDGSLCPLRTLHQLFLVLQEESEANNCGGASVVPRLTSCSMITSLKLR